jgi:hypothetical protein
MADGAEFRITGSFVEDSTLDAIGNLPECVDVKTIFYIFAITWGTSYRNLFFEFAF